MRKKFIAMIPARMGATRFPGKPLVDICGKPMIEHVWQRIKLCNNIDSLYIVTCDLEIKEAAEAFGAEVILTSDKHERCTDRVAEGCQKLLASGGDFDAVINVQGDEPLLNPATLNLLIKPFLEEKNVKVVNLIENLDSEEDIDSYNNLKVVFDTNNYALYYSRQPIPDNRKAKVNYYKQLGIYAFSKEAIIKYPKMAQTPLEIAESNDILRFLQNGIQIKVMLSPHKTQGVDTPADHKRVCALMRRDKIFFKYMNMLGEKNER